MKIKFKRSGGFGGMLTEINLNTDTLSEDKNNTLKGLLDKVTPAGQRTVKTIDGFHYDLDVETDNGKKHFGWVDGDSTENEQALADFLLEQ